MRGLKKLRGVEEGARPEARQHKTGAIGKGLARARDVEFERGHAESSAQRTIAQRAQPRVRDMKTEYISPAQRTIAQRATLHKHRCCKTRYKGNIPQPRVRDTKTEAYNLNNTRF